MKTAYLSDFTSCTKHLILTLILYCSNWHKLLSGSRKLPSH